MGRTGLDWTGLDWTGLDWTGRDGTAQQGTIRAYSQCTVYTLTHTHAHTHAYMHMYTQARATSSKFAKVVQERNTLRGIEMCVWKCIWTRV